MNSKKAGAWRIGELAKAAGVSTDTLRHYERKGVLQSQRSGNRYRDYPADALDRLRIIRRALAVGFTLDELTDIFKVLDRGGAPCHQVRNLAADKLQEIEAHLQEMTALRDELQETLQDWDSRLAKTVTGQRAGLLRTLANRNPAKQASTRIRLRNKLKRKGKEK